MRLHWQSPLAISRDNAPVVVSRETCGLYLGLPRVGKTGSLCYQTIDAPGWTLATSCFIDIFQETALARVAGGGPVWLANPGQDGGWPSTMAFSPLTGCDTAEGAIANAGILMNSVPKDANSATWHDWGFQLLRLAMHAAALVPGYTILDARYWVQNPSDPGFAKALASPFAAPGWDEELDHVNERPEETLGGIIPAADSALSWLANPTMAALACPAGDDNFSAENLIDNGGTLYLIGRNTPHSTLAPFYSLLVAHILEVALKKASTMPGGRLAPTGTAILDEAANLCTGIDLPRMTSLLGGRGVTVFVGAQSIAQLKEAFGENGASAILSNSGLKVIFGGYTDGPTLTDLSVLCDDEDTWNWVKQQDGSKHRLAVSQRVFSPSRLRLIPRGRALCLESFTRPFLMRVPSVRDHPRYDPLPATFDFETPEPELQPERLALPAGSGAAGELTAGGIDDDAVAEVVDGIVVSAFTASEKGGY